MAVIDFLPDRLNNPPVVWKGFTSGEFLLAAVSGVIAGIPLAVPLPHLQNVVVRRLIRASQTRTGQLRRQHP